VNEPTTFQIVLFCVLFAAVITWLAMVVWLFRRLRLRHPETFEAIGSPNLFTNNTPQTNWLFLKFLCGRQWKALDDGPLMAVLHVMRWFAVIYVILFAALVGSSFMQ
jgi:hypothetical protein